MTRLPCYPLLLAAYPALFLFEHNRGQLERSDLWGPLGVCLVSLLAVWGVTAGLLRSLQRPALIASALWGLLFGYGALRTAAEAALRNTGTEHLIGPVSVGLWLSVSLALLIPLTLRTRGKERLLSVWAPGLNAMAAVLLAIPLYGLLSAGPASSAVGPESAGPVQPKAQLGSEAPDFYYLVLDGFGSFETLASLYDLDLGDFRRGLVDRGFHVPRASRANYLRTLQSLSSALNMVLLTPSRRPRETVRQDTRSIVRSIRRNRVMLRLEALGYDVHVYATGYPGSEMPGAPHRMAPSAGLSEFDNTLIGLTPLQLLAAAFDETNPYALHRRRIQFTFDSLPEVAATRGPKFVFAHVVAPHPPFVFDAAGQAVDPEVPFAFFDGHHYLMRESRERYIAGYRGQVRYVAGRLLTLVDGILAASERPAVIILQGDHGPGVGLHHEDIERSDLLERAFILNAYHVEDETLRARLYDGITPVNSFRILLSHYFGDELPLQPDQTFYNNESEPRGFVDVTARVLEAAKDRFETR